MRCLSKRIPIQGRGYKLAYQGFGPLMCNMFSLVCEATGDAVVVDPSTHDKSEFQKLEEHLDGKNVKAENYQLAAEQGRYFGLNVPRLPEPTHAIKDGQIINVGDSIQLRAIHTPGHAPGHVAFVDERPTETNDGAVVIGGDLLFRGSVGRTDFFNASIDDLFASLRRLYQELDDDSIVLSGHTTPTFLKEERNTNPFVASALQRPEEWFEEAKERHGWK